MSEHRRPVLFDARRDRMLRNAGIRAWAIVGIVAVAVVAYTAFSTFSTFILPLIVAAVLGIIFEPVASFFSRFMPRQVAALLVLSGIFVGAVVIVAAGGGHQQSVSPVDILFLGAFTEHFFKGGQIIRLTAFFISLHGLRTS